MQTKFSVIKVSQSEGRLLKTILHHCVAIVEFQIKKFWDSVKPFLSDKGSHRNENCSLLRNGQITKDETEIF